MEQRVTEYYQGKWGAEIRCGSCGQTQLDAGRENHRRCKACGASFICGVGSYGLHCPGRAHEEEGHWADPPHRH